MSGLSGQNLIFPPFFNGDGSDGDMIDTVPVSLINTRSIMPKSFILTTSEGTFFHPNCHKIFVKGLLKVSTGTGIISDGGDANQVTPGTGTPSEELGGGGDGGIPQNGGTPGTAGGDSPTYGSLGGAGGTGATAGGQANFISNLGAIGIWLRNFQAMYSGLLYYPSGEYFGVVQIPSGGAGGGAGGGSTYRGGAGGGGGGVIWIAADTIWLEAGAIISSYGGKGGEAQVSGSATGGGGGGGGGAILLFCNHFINEGASIQVTGGTGGVGHGGGSSGGTGAKGNIAIFTPQGITIM
jgi:fibronectin-binding autotransporter adhesin